MGAEGRSEMRFMDGETVTVAFDRSVRSLTKQERRDAIEYLVQRLREDNVSGDVYTEDRRIVFRRVTGFKYMMEFCSTASKVTV